MNTHLPSAVLEPDGGLPKLLLTTDDGRDPASKTRYVPGSYTLVDGDQRVTGELTIRGRGNTTWGAPKKPWRVKFAHKTRPLDMTATQKNWGLLAEWYDRSRMNNHFALTVGAHMRGLVWTPQYRYVSLTMNGSYRGLYGLVDLVRMEKGRVPGHLPTADSDGAHDDWLFEISNKEKPFAVAAAHDWGFTTPVRSNWIQYKGYKRPTFVQSSYVEGRLDTFESRLALRDWDRWKQLADPVSFADWWLINELIANADSGALFSSCKMHTADGKVVMGPLWDQDLSLGITWGSRRRVTGWSLRGRTPWLADMFDDPAWMRMAHTRWETLKDVVTHRLPGGSIDGFFDTVADRIRPYAEADDRLWGTEVWDATWHFADEVARRKTWLKARINWLDDHLPWG